MNWWIWSLLVLLALGFHAYLGWRTVRKGIGLMRQIASSTQQAQALLGRPESTYRPASSVLAQPPKPMAAAGERSHSQRQA